MRRCLCPNKETSRLTVHYQEGGSQAGSHNPQLTFISPLACLWLTYFCNCSKMFEFSQKKETSFLSVCRAAFVVWKLNTMTNEASNGAVLHFWLEPERIHLRLPSVCDQDISSSTSLLRASCVLWMHLEDGSDEVGPEQNLQTAFKTAPECTKLRKGNHAGSEEKSSNRNKSVSPFMAYKIPANFHMCGDSQKLVCGIRTWLSFAGSACEKVKRSEAKALSGSCGD